jgi:Nucleotidyltransferase domain
MTTGTDRLRSDLRRARECAADLDLREGESLILTGSATLPFETRGGDIDLVLVTPSEERYLGFARSRERERETEQAANEFAISYVQLSNGKEMDIEVWPERRVAAASAGVGSKIRTIEEVEADFTRVGGLDVKVGTDLFHALGWGIPVVGTDAFGRLHDRVSWQAYQAFKRDTALVNVRDATKGIPSSLRDERADEAYLKLCWAADSLVDAMIFHTGHSITRWKWRLRYLSLLPARVGDWYREIRFRPVLEPADLLRHVEVLKETFATFGETPPQDLVRPARADAGNQPVI